MKHLSTLPAAFLGAAVLFLATEASAQCPATELAHGFQAPIGVTQSNTGNLIVSESGTMAPNTGRISIVDLNGAHWPLLTGLPSGVSDVGSPSGPSGVFMRGRTLYVAIGVGDVGISGPAPGTEIPNPNGPSSPILSSVLAIHFSAGVERTKATFTMTLADQQALASGQKVTLSNGSDKITVELVVNFPNYTAQPLPTFASNVALSNPFGLVIVGDRLYVTDGGMNSVWQVDLSSGLFSTLAQFPNFPNPLFPAVGGPVEQPVPTGIAYSNGELLVTLFSGVPFAPGASVVEQVDPRTGAITPLITGLKTAIGVLPLEAKGNTEYLVLQHASAGPFFGGPGLLLRFESPAVPPVTISNCLTLPTAMTLDERTNTLYVTELGGRIVAIPVAP